MRPRFAVIPATLPAAWPAVLAAATILALPAPAYAVSGAEVDIVLAFFVCVAVVVGLILFAHYRNAVQRHQTLRAMVEKGMEIPPGLLGPSARPASSRTDQRRGILLVCAGVGIGLFFLAEGGPQELLLGLIPAFIGVGYLIVAKIEKSRETSQPALP